LADPRRTTISHTYKTSLVVINCVYYIIIIIIIIITAET